MKNDMIPGGKGDKAKPSDFDPEQLKMGIKVEMEHTKDRRLAREIAMDHLSEDPRYYTKLKKVHKEHAAMRSDMHSFEELLEMMSSVNAWLTEGAAPPPFKAAERAKQGMPALKSRTGATPPPLPKKKEPSADTKAELGQLRQLHTTRPTELKNFKPKATSLKPAPRSGPDVHSKFDTSTTEGLAAQIRFLLGEGGGSRATKGARQMKHYKATQPDWLRKTQMGRDPQYPYGMNTPSEKMYSRGHNRGQGKDPMAAKGESLTARAAGSISEAPFGRLRAMKPMAPVGGRDSISKPKDWKLKRLTKAHKI
jgi:hypothetical protein